MLQRGVNNTHFQIVKLGRVSSLSFKIHTSLKHFFEKVPFLDLHWLRLIMTFQMIHFLGGPTNHPNAHCQETMITLEKLKFEHLNHVIFLMNLSNQAPKMSYFDLSS